ncbi:MADS-box transcription factor Map1 [Schizosaccharomyces japonicus yFS275]|uniref:MADS-box transcription factor Map1 n=1 Tax=Schizosaccharomyces japonicus (strain yFS275 / FY16936) TaxID=402676 RepID=B6JV10_SCHJY|nr:MADS-box transcription factor Map1 [Schizosaccharomyces japonicus yFS275]EEB05211.1 MADS-box transcription factor Map1 [Schizosaccharomyces japonicus yFS275]
MCKRVRDDLEPSTENASKQKTPPGAAKTSRFIQDKAKRRATFSKRRAGLFKKALELSVLTGTQIMVIAVSESGFVHTFATSKLEGVVNSKEGQEIIARCLQDPSVPDSVEVEEEGLENCDLGSDFGAFEKSKDANKEANSLVDDSVDEFLKANIRTEQSSQKDPIFGLNTNAGDIRSPTFTPKSGEDAFEDECIRMETNVSSQKSVQLSENAATTRQLKSRLDSSQNLCGSTRFDAPSSVPSQKQPLLSPETSPLDGHFSTTAGVDEFPALPHKNSLSETTFPNSDHLQFPDLKRNVWADSQESYASMSSEPDTSPTYLDFPQPTDLKSSRSVPKVREPDAYDGNSNPDSGIAKRTSAKRTAVQKLASSSAPELRSSCTNERVGRPQLMPLSDLTRSPTTCAAAFDACPSLFQGKSPLLTVKREPLESSSSSAPVTMPYNIEQQVHSVPYQIYRQQLCQQLQMPPFSSCQSQQYYSSSPRPIAYPPNVQLPQQSAPIYAYASQQLSNASFPSTPSIPTMPTTGYAINNPNTMNQQASNYAPAQPWGYSIMPMHERYS